MPMMTFSGVHSGGLVGHMVPGAEPGGGGYVAQRMFSAKDRAPFAAGYSLVHTSRTSLCALPWILVGLASIILYPTCRIREGYVMVMIDHLPASSGD